MTRGIIGIYVVKNTNTGQVYVGQSVDVEYRIYKHFSALRYGRHVNRYLQMAYTEDPEAFTWELICECAEDELNKLEKRYIQIFRAKDPAYGYNMQRGGGATHRISEETKEKLREAATGKAFSEEHRKRIGEANHRRGQTEETKEKLKNILGRPVVKLDEDGNFIARYPSIHEAARQNNRHLKSIQSALYGITKRSAGYRWCYE